MKAVSASKLEPVGMHSEFAAVLRAFTASSKHEGDVQQTMLLLDIGASSTKVLIAHGVKEVFARVVEIGGRHFDRAVADQLDCSMDEASRRRHGLAVQGPVCVSSGAAAGLSAELSEQPSANFAPEGADLREPLEMLTDEIRMCLRYHAGVYPARAIDRVIFVGGEARSTGLCQQIARRLKVKAQVADPIAGVARGGQEPTSGVDLRVPQPGWAVALGLCLSPTDL